ncbi:hypothetical protein, partial [Streptococcus pneumoniae]|uniref:hypothetical protein n=1 Tax=Streptococcus pneumoniae TaxID=1313 RepID=UPI0018B0A0E9
YRAYGGGNIDVMTDIVPGKVMQHAATLATVKIYLKEWPNTGATATFVPRCNGKKLFTSAPTIAAPVQKDAMDATTGWSGT